MFEKSNDTQADVMEDVIESTIHLVPNERKDVEYLEMFFDTVREPIRHIINKILRLSEVNIDLSYIKKERW